MLTFRKKIKPLYFSLKLAINRIPILWAKALSYLPVKVADYDLSVVDPPSQERTTLDWITQQHLQENDLPEYHKVDEACTFPRKNLPKTGDSAEHPQFSKESIASPQESFVAVIPQGRVWGQYGAVITEDNHLLRDISVYRLRGAVGYHRVYSDWHLCRIRKLRGAVAVLATDSANVYYHWVMDMLTRYALLLRAGYTLDSFDSILVGSCDKPFQKETLELLGIEVRHSSKVVRMGGCPYVQAERLIVPSYPTMGGQYRAWHIDFLRETFLPKAQKHVEKMASKKRIYISRGDAKYRRVLNEDKVISLLSGHGFEVVQLADFSFLEQVALMAATDVVIAPHGSGLTNILFCKPGAKIIEIFSPEMVALYFWKISDLCHLDYYYTVGDRVRSSDFDQTWNANADIDVSISRLEATIKLANLGT